VVMHIRILRVMMLLWLIDDSIFVIVQLVRCCGVDVSNEDYIVWQYNVQSIVNRGKSNYSGNVLLWLLLLWVYSCCRR
jgi:hypothetical protein